jgi:hypothetical protein
MRRRLPFFPPLPPLEGLKGGNNGNKGKGERVATVGARETEGDTVVDYRQVARQTLDELKV